jgi:hypothetical protein
MSQKNRDKNKLAKMKKSGKEQRERAIRNPIDKGRKNVITKTETQK